MIFCFFTPLFLLVALSALDAIACLHMCVCMWECVFVCAFAVKVRSATQTQEVPSCLGTVEGLHRPSQPRCGRSRCIWIKILLPLTDAERARCVFSLCIHVQLQKCMESKYSRFCGKLLHNCSERSRSWFCLRFRAIVFTRHRFESVERILFLHRIPSTGPNKTADTKIKPFEMSKGTPMLSLLNVCANHKSWELHNHLTCQIKSGQVWFTVRQF